MPRIADMEQIRRERKKRKKKKKKQVRISYLDMKNCTMKQIAKGKERKKYIEKW